MTRSWELDIFAFGGTRWWARWAGSGRLGKNHCNSLTDRKKVQVQVRSLPNGASAIDSSAFKLHPSLAL
ncbi:hypothetical protein CY34DRAFT_811329 [Suillus luteus UH-Slu-Lm8-n1]|uniref:Unplaced genomic scaffold CY34scaffold_403, whole genome shotgun sequence n=1 Tax=Suillus luteus UH-Slu-Lm8-n1 TaxID=930992 RepID=A0A0D0A3Z8_9AGAM|nr:hypothetical protein CY34DRAFT_811329 [Suillus luteus UH-Slu-Lm8-n1]